jgi:Fic family protein
MMADLDDSPGEFRGCGVGVYKSGVAVHIAPEHDDVPDLVDDLMDWCKVSDLHPLIMSCIFHGQFEYIHPFVDGNGRMGRLWHSLILSGWRPVFGYLPIESWIDLNKRGYYNSLKEADRGNIAVFVKFMLLMIRMAIDELVDEITYSVRKDPDIGVSMLEIISGDPRVTAVRMAEILDVNVRTVKRYLSSMTKDGMIKRVGSDKTGHWEIIKISSL